MSRVEKYNTKKRSRRVFSLEEDQRLLKIIHRIGTKDWGKVAARMKNRTPRQCKERWSTYLSPYINKSPWTPEEEELLIQKYQEIGPKWSKIATFFIGRPDNCIKNHWNATMRRKERHMKKLEREKDNNRISPDESSADPQPINSSLVKNNASIHTQRNGKQSEWKYQDAYDILSITNLMNSHPEKHSGHNIKTSLSESASLQNNNDRPSQIHPNAAASNPESLNNVYNGYSGGKQIIHSPNPNRWEQQKPGFMGDPSIKASNAKNNEIDILDIKSLLNC
ncbi:hypothetical protein TRFO_36704 [Tritrichomonas foetus]|uniref:Myb-like DNA-binding domain containing protein n=1 Tax=Tritrichomonas foetus TaxID=1144522 RepID=A0A1J4JDB5_9EUKA|nr:hypothetical protein TRFO_36704 [Tritrichomonas foetus]|eukprot:OHS97146.1 hypothetical protein TRFO_36704 [Tritrichomonas foetus]